MDRIARPRRAMTLMEVLVATLLLAVFGLAAAAALSLAMRQWQQVGTKVNAIQNARFIVGAIATEVRTAISCQNSTIGWQTITPALGDATGILMPNANNATSGSLVFTRPNPTGSPPLWNPLSPTWTNTQAQGYNRVCYNTTGATTLSPVPVASPYPTGNTTVQREVISYSTTGAATSSGVESIASCQNVVLNFRSGGPNYVVVNVVCQEGRYVATYATNCLVIGR